MSAGAIPIDRVVLCSASSGRQRCYVYVPPAARRDGTVLVAVHGIGRDAREQALAWRPLARATGWPLLAPEFDPHGARGYQRLGWDGDGPCADALLDSTIESIGRELGQPPSMLVLAGYSGGAQFCHRYAMVRPQRVRALIVGAAGWYTWPDPRLPWPVGMDTTKQLRARALDLQGFLRVPTLVYVGDRDVERGSTLRSGPVIDTLQGTDRRARARAWHEALQRAAGGRGQASRAALLELAGVSHEFAAAVRAGIVARAGQWLAEVDPRLATGYRVASLPPGDQHVDR